MKTDIEEQRLMNKRKRVYDNLYIKRDVVENQKFMRKDH